MVQTLELIEMVHEMELQACKHLIDVLVHELYAYPKLLDGGLVNKGASLASEIANSSDLNPIEFIKHDKVIQRIDEINSLDGFPKLKKRKMMNF